MRRKQPTENPNCCLKNRHRLVLQIQKQEMSYLVCQHDTQVCPIENGNRTSEKKSLFCVDIVLISSEEFQKKSLKSFI